MNEAPPFVTGLMRHWGVPQTAVANAAALSPEISVCHWQHTMRDAPDTELAANTLVLMLTDTDSLRHRGCLTEAAPARRGGLRQHSIGTPARPGRGGLTARQVRRACEAMQRRRANGPGALTESWRR